ncbi:fumarylacetoacetate hydrolase family protein [Hoeflea prorocentri]|uniref:Fumarylacetoacetate hydrolase family protein n=2 Tax=Hoeflea prorocentri TaxID=1922333 RepID=A0A9X3UE67_9HYPH|nr:fumarylacetoacetate hydrolase family protein [Hoeflea prorocentri]MCY6379773.1 fumarylacetoacetate hydrolase family protein [Hoeflea prorocentri]MDA5397573.1 fumarylacetoacetate hydrolase family protein [Hoeflea prorocentri]
MDMNGTFVGRIWDESVNGPCLVAIHDNALFDITSSTTPTMSALLDIDELVGFVRDKLANARMLCGLDDLLDSSASTSSDKFRLLAPNDLQAIKACGVTFAQSMIERVIEERAAGDPAKAAAIRKRCEAVIGSSLEDLKAGSPKADAVKETLIAEGLWSQYLEVGIGPDAEVFTKSQPMSAVGWGAEIGLHPVSKWNNPEPEIVLAVNSRGQARGATLGNDVNLRDVEGRSALLLGKAKDNNASCALGPFIRLFDETYDMDNVRNAELNLVVEGPDGFVLKGASTMSKISRDPEDLVSQTFGAHHQYPDGFMLFMGTLFAPTQDRHTPGEGFTHELGDRVSIANNELGELINTVRLSTQCEPWTFGTGALMQNLAGRGLLSKDSSP